MRGWFNPRDWAPRDPDRGCLILITFVVISGIIVGGAVRFI